MKKLTVVCAFLALCFSVIAHPLTLKKGDHICIIGNTLADRMQHSGWLESLIYAQFPKHDLVFRNLGFSGDEITVRLRSQEFGTPDEWLKRTANRLESGLHPPGFSSALPGLTASCNEANPRGCQRPWTIV